MMMFNLNEIVYWYTGVFNIYLYEFSMVDTVVLMNVVSLNVWQ